MTYAYRYPVDRKAHVRRSWLFGERCWEAGKPGGVYLAGQGWHFHSWAEAIAYATRQDGVVPTNPFDPKDYLARCQRLANSGLSPGLCRQLLAAGDLGLLRDVERLTAAQREQLSEVAARQERDA